MNNIFQQHLSIITFFLNIFSTITFNNVFQQHLSTTSFNSIFQHHLWTIILIPLWTSTGAAQLEPLPFGAVRGQLRFPASGVLRRRRPPPAAVGITPHGPPPTACFRISFIFCVECSAAGAVLPVGDHTECGFGQCPHRGCPGEGGTRWRPWGSHLAGRHTRGTRREQPTTSH